jgi:hypothetical protein
MTDFSPLDTFRDPVREPDPARSSRIRDEFRARIATMAPDDEGRRPFDPASIPSTRSCTRLRQSVVALAALGLVLLLAGVGAVVLSPARRSDSLDQLALAAATRSDAHLQDGQYLYLSERAVAHGSTSQRDQWTASNGTGQAVVAPLLIGPQSSDPPSITLYPAPGSLDFAGMSYEQLRSLPTEPEALLDRLGALGVASSARPGAQAVALGRVLALQVTPPEVGSAAIRALARLGGTAIGAVPDAAGRVGVGIRGDNGDGTAWLVVIDPGSGLALAAHDTVDPTTPTATAPGRVWLAQTVTASLSTD